MKAIQFEIMGQWAHFKRPETNNNPLSHDMITKTALIGMMGAVLGIERADMKPMFPQFSDDLLYNVTLLNAVKKTSVGLTSRKAISTTDAPTPRSFEIIKDPHYLITLALCNVRSEARFDQFVNSLKEGLSIYPPVLGWHNCPAELRFICEGEVSDQEMDGDFETAGFVKTSDCTPINIYENFRIGFDKLPTFQNDDFWNLPERYVQIVYPDFPNKLQVSGKYREFRSEGNVQQLCLI